MLPKEAIEEFRQAYRQEYGKDIEPTEAGELAMSLINLMRIVHRSIPLAQPPSLPAETLNETKQKTPKKPKKTKEKHGKIEICACMGKYRKI